jgi:3-deoxy-manno-octulosonate cytidylyltransferase (CMP-KDO synthetase)
MEAALGPVVVAAAEQEIAAAVERAGGRAILTRPDHASGSDRVFEAVEALDPGRKHDTVVNLQGDKPTVDPRVIRAALSPLDDAAVDIATVAAVITREEEKDDPNVVKVALGLKAHESVARALYFSRARVPAGEGPLYYHIGLYAYRRESLARFVQLPQSVLEARERLEQLRALEAGMRIEVALVDTVPLDVNTPADLARARQLLAGDRRD